MFTDSNPFTYLLTTAKLDATGQRWVASLANYNFTLHYKTGKLNEEAAALSRIPLGQEEELHALNTIVVKAIINRGYSGDSSIPEVPPDTISVIAKHLVVDSTTKLSKEDWKKGATSRFRHRTNNYFNQQSTFAICCKRKENHQR